MAHPLHDPEQGFLLQKTSLGFKLPHDGSCIGWSIRTSHLEPAISNQPSRTSHLMAIPIHAHPNSEELGYGTFFCAAMDRIADLGHHARLFDNSSNRH